MSKRTTNIPDSARCGLPLLRQRPAEGSGDREWVCVLPPVTPREDNRPVGVHGFRVGYAGPIGHRFRGNREPRRRLRSWASPATCRSKAGHFARY